MQASNVWTAELSADAQWLVWSTAGGASDILARPWADTAATPINLGASFSEHSPALSPDGRWLAWVSDVSGTDEVYVRSFPEAGAVSKISVSGGREPRWHPGGASLLYRAPRGQLMEVALQTVGNRVVAGQRSSILDAGIYRRSPDYVGWDIHPDGDRFVFVTSGVGSSIRLSLTLNVTSRPGQR